VIRKFADKRPILFSVTVVIVTAIVLLLATALFSSAFGIDMGNLENTELDLPAMSALSLSKVVFSAVVILILITLGMKSEIIPSRKGIGRGLLLGWFLILLAIFLFLVQTDFGRAASFDSSKSLLLIPLAVYTLLIGVSEEFLCRGILYNVIFNKYGNVHAAVLISSVIFGIVHLTNLIGGASVGETLLQVLYASAFGVLIAAVYARCKNIWAVVLLHALFDFCGYAAVILAPAAAAEMDLVLADTIGVVMTVVVSVVSVCIGLFLIRKSWRAGSAVGSVPADDATQLVEADELPASESLPTMVTVTEEV